MKKGKNFVWTPDQVRGFCARTGQAPEQYLNENNTGSTVSDTELKRDKTAALGGATQGKEKSLGRATVRFVGYRVKPLDPDNFAGSVKDLLDGLRHAQIISGDEPWKIILETEQERVKHYNQEKTVITVDIPSA